MGFELRWVGQDERDRVAETRMQCYAPASGDLEDYKTWVGSDPREQPGDYLLAEQDGTAVGTATSLSMTMWVRGAPIACQGVAWVGTIKTHRRSGGIASRIMCEALRKGRERKQIVSALMPFRASFYEHFGYGLVERRNRWTVPLSILPTGPSAGMRFMKPDDLTLIRPFYQRFVERGQCDIERTEGGWVNEGTNFPKGFCVIDQPDSSPPQSWMMFGELKQDGKTLIRVRQAAWDSHEAFLRQLYFLSNLRDQYSLAQIELPLNLPLNRLLKEPQLEHRPVEQLTAEVIPQTRMMVRILDHARFLESLHLPESAGGRVSVSVKETEGNVSQFQIELSGGRMKVTPASGKTDVECSDHTWAAIACGDLSASVAARLGLISVALPKALPVLDVLCVGPLPFSNEYF